MTQQQDHDSTTEAIQPVSGDNTAPRITPELDKLSMTLKLHSHTHNCSYYLTHITYGTLHAMATTSSTDFEYFPPGQTGSYSADPNFNTKSQGNKTHFYNSRVYQIVTYTTTPL